MLVSNKKFGRYLTSIMGDMDHHAFIETYTKRGSDARGNESPG